MIRMAIDRKGGEIRLECKGTFPEIVADLGTLIHMLHLKMSKENFFLGMDFERTFRDPGFWDFVFKPRKEDSELLKSAWEGEESDD